VYDPTGVSGTTPGPSPGATADALHAHNTKGSIIFVMSRRVCSARATLLAHRRNRVFSVDDSRDLSRRVAIDFVRKPDLATARRTLRPDTSVRRASVQKCPALLLPSHIDDRQLEATSLAARRPLG